MKFTLDTEFNEFQGELISIALVAEDLEINFYEVLPCENPGPWVAQHVIPVLNKTPIHTDPEIARWLLTEKLQKWFSQFGDSEIEIICDWPDDVRYLCETLITGPGYMIQTPPVIKFTIDRNLPSTAENSKIPHNALEDAIALMKAVLQN